MLTDQGKIAAFNVLDRLSRRLPARVTMDIITDAPRCVVFTVAERGFCGAYAVSSVELDCIVNDVAISSRIASKWEAELRERWGVSTTDKSNA